MAPPSPRIQALTPVLGSSIIEGWLIKSREHGKLLPLIQFQSKWVRRYFVLRQDEAQGRFFVDEFRSDNKRRLRKSLDLERCTQVDSYLRLSGNHASEADYRWIFSMHFAKRDSDKKVELYLVASSEQEMNKWVDQLCRACSLEKAQDNPTVPEQRTVSDCVVVNQPATLPRATLPAQLPSNTGTLTGGSMSARAASRSFESILDTPLVDPTRDAIHESFAMRQEEEDEQNLYEFIFPIFNPVPEEVRIAARFTRRLMGVGNDDSSETQEETKSPGYWDDIDEFRGNYILLTKTTTPKPRNYKPKKQNDDARTSQRQARASSESTTYSNMDEPPADFGDRLRLSHRNEQSTFEGRGHARIPSSASACSSSSQPSASESSSGISSSSNHCVTEEQNPPLPPAVPPRTPSRPLNVGSLSRLNQTLPAPTPEMVDESADAESSGETIKMNEHTDSESRRVPPRTPTALDAPPRGPAPWNTESRPARVNEIRGASFTPPLVDRTKKPQSRASGGRTTDEESESMSHVYISARGRFVQSPQHQTQSSPRTPRLRQETGLPSLPRTDPRNKMQKQLSSEQSPGWSSPGRWRRPLDYVDPMASGPPTPVSVRSPTPTTPGMNKPVEYVLIDADKTMALGKTLQSREQSRSRATFD